MMGNFGHVWINMILVLVVTIGVIFGFVYLVVWAVRRISGNTQPGAHHLTGQSAKDAAQVRYAKGEISRDEYFQILTDLER